jgi:hypothetical protein
MILKFVRGMLVYLRCQVRLLTLPSYYRLIGKQPVHVLHIGKTGGTAMEEAFRNVPNTMIFHCHRISLRDIPAGDKIIFLVRDPIGRFVSGFYSRKRQGRPRYNVPWSSQERLAFGSFQTPNDLAIALSSKDPHTRDLAIGAMKAIAHVKTHYKNWLISADYLLKRKADILFIGRQETLEQDFQILRQILGIPAASLPTDPVRAHRNPTDLGIELKPEAIENLREWYREDYQMLEVISPLRDEILGRPLAARNG